MATDIEYINYKEFVEGLSTTEDPDVTDKAVVCNETDGPRAIPANTSALSNVATDSDLTADASIELQTANGKKKAPANLFAKKQFGTDNIKNLPTTITSFRTGDVIVVDGPNGLVKMPAESLANIMKEGDETPLDFSIADKNGNMVAAVVNGGDFLTKKFNSKSVNEKPSSESSPIDFAITDENGNCVAMVVNGGDFLTKKFNSKSVNEKPSSESSPIDFAIADKNGNIVLLVSGKRLIAGEFDSIEVYNAISKTFFKGSKNYGKSVGVFGGSHSVFVESEKAKDMWRKYLAMDVTTYGIGGAGFSSLQDVHTSIQRQVDGAAIKDVYVLWGSTNDFSHNREIGTYKDYTYLDNYDESKLVTQCGGFNYCLKKLYEKNPLCEVYCFTGFDFFNWESGYDPFSTQTNSLGYTYQQYVDEMKKCCKLFSIPVLDQNDICGLNKFNYTNYFKSDNLHMNELGYRKIGMQQVQFLANGV